MSYREYKIVAQKMYRKPDGKTVACYILENGRMCDVHTNAIIQPGAGWVLIQHLRKPQDSEPLVWDNVLC